ncbi:MAG: DUF4255 domain-containing protein [Pyrinomonadaceae bacterium]
MLADVFQLLARNLDAYFTNAPGGGNEPQSAVIKLLQQDGDEDAIKFPLNKVTPLLINVEEEGHLRPGDRFSRISVNGSRESVFPDVRLNLYILFVSNFQEYADALNYLSLIVKYFQSHPVLDHQNTPELHEDIDKLIIELKTLPINEQNEVWGALRSAYRPSLLYRVRMLVFQAQPSVTAPGDVVGVQTTTGNFN